MNDIIAPVYVADIVDLAGKSPNFCTGATEANVNRSPTEMRTHGEIGNEGDHGDGAGQVIEDPILTGFLMTQEKEDGGCETHDCAYGEVSAGAIVGEGNVGDIAVDIRTCIGNTM